MREDDTEIKVIIEINNYEMRITMADTSETLKTTIDDCVKKIGERITKEYEAVTGLSVSIPTPLSFIDSFTASARYHINFGSDGILDAYMIEVTKINQRGKEKISVRFNRRIEDGKEDSKTRDEVIKHANAIYLYLKEIEGNPLNVSINDFVKESYTVEFTLDRFREYKSKNPDAPTPPTPPPLPLPPGAAGWKRFQGEILGGLEDNLYAVFYDGENPRKADEILSRHKTLIEGISSDCDKNHSRVYLETLQGWLAKDCYGWIHNKSPVFENIDWENIRKDLLAQIQGQIKKLGTKDTASLYIPPANGQMRGFAI